MTQATKYKAYMSLALRIGIDSEVNSTMKYLAIVVCVILSWLPLYYIQAQAGPELPEGLFTLGSDTIHCPDIYKGDTVEAVFYFQNRGTHPVKIYQVHPGCQCTAPIYHDTVRAGQVDSVILVFYSKNNHDEYFAKDAIVLNNVQEKNYFVVGHMLMPQAGQEVHNKRIHLTNTAKPNKVEQQKGTTPSHQEKIKHQE